MRQSVPAVVLLRAVVVAQWWWMLAAGESLWLEPVVGGVMWIGPVLVWLAC